MTAPHVENFDLAAYFDRVVDEPAWVLRLPAILPETPK